MGKHIYASILKDEMAGFIEMRDNQGFRDANRFILASLDKYLVSQSIGGKSLDAKVVDAWLAYACSDLSSSSKHGYVSYYSAFAKYLRICGICVFVPECVKIRESYVPYVFSEQEVENIISAADNIEIRKYSKIQFPMLLRLLHGCGLRLGEALSLRKSDVDVNTGVIFIRKAKGNRDRFVPMEPSLTNVFSRYYKCLLQDKPDDAWVFKCYETDADIQDGTDKPRSKEWARYNFRRTLEKAGISLQMLPRNRRNICPNCLRHTFMVRSLRKQDLAGTDIYGLATSISVYAGHRSLTGTQHYLHMTAENSIDIINATNGYSKGMFPVIKDESVDCVIRQRISQVNPNVEITEANATNECSKGMFPEVPR
jgi:integrase